MCCTAGRDTTKKMDLSDRNRAILRELVNAYIESAEPVGSRTLSKRVRLGLSPATIRNAMADLEEMGLLYHQHASAGRLPTESGLRYFVDYLLEKEGLTWGDQLAIERGLISGEDDLESTLRKAVRLLADFSGHAAVVSAPRHIARSLRHIEFVRIRDGLVLVITVSDSGIVQNRFARIAVDLPEERLRYWTSYLNRKLAHMSLAEARDSLLQDLEAEKKVFDALMDAFIAQRQGSAERGDVFVGGQMNLLDQPEFSSMERLRALLQAFEEKTALVCLLDRCLESRGVQVLIGAEGPGIGVPGCGMVLAPYLAGEEPLGSLGVVGPMRMNYARAIALVEYVAQVLSERFKESGR